MSTVEATDTALLLRAGSLAAPMEIIEERTIGPILGAENIAKGFHSVTWGFAGRGHVHVRLLPAVRRDLQRLRWRSTCCCWWPCCRMLQATLTLPGMAAMALALGMAIDANVLINERVREELRNGASPQAAIHAGYDRALGHHPRLQRHHADRRSGAAGLWLRPGARFRRGALPGHPDAACSRRCSFSRGVVNLWYGRRKKLQVGIASVQVWRLTATAGWPQAERNEDIMEFFKIRRDIPFMRHALVLNAISFVDLLRLAVFFLLHARAALCRSSSPAAP
jgi:preprotein translocase subunit SecD